MSAHVVIVLYGSRGDIQPGVALALELQRRGRRVSVAAPPNLTEFARDCGVVRVYPVGLDTHQAWSSDEAREIARTQNPVVRARFALATVRAGFAAFDDALVALLAGPDATIADADLLVAAPLCQTRVLAISQRLGIPMLVLRFGPMSANGVIGAVPGMTDRWSQEWKRRSWRVADRITWHSTAFAENGFRRRIGLRAASAPLPVRLSALRIPQIQAYDPALVPGLAQEFSDTRPLVGFLDLPTEQRTAQERGGAADEQLSRWLGAGAPPIFVTFGSMPLSDPDEVIAVIARAVRARGLRCLFALGPRRGADPHDPALYFAGALDHSLILPRCAGVIHHGGAGTTAAGLRAGLPTAIFAVTADQPFWAARVEALGVGVGERFKRLGPDTAARAVDAVCDQNMCSAATDLAGALIPADKAVALTADICDNRIAAGHPRAGGPG